MCGINGIFMRNGGPVDVAALARMTTELTHRGPDAEGSWYEGAIGLGHRRLSIRDLSPLGAQPMADASGRIVASFNGEIYNDGSLRRELEGEHGVRFRSHSDTEVIPYGFLAWGPRVFERLEGIFAIALWDRSDQTLWLARDAIGTKPLFYEATAERLLFASEAKSIFAARGGVPAYDPAGLHTFLAAGHAGPARSIYAGLNQVAPGTVIRWDAHGVAETRFWRPTRCGDISDPHEAIDRLRRTLAEVVQSQLVADVPVAVLQSGGIDSTLVSMAAAKTLPFGNDARPTLFTATFRERSHDESDLAKLVAGELRLDHRLVTIDEGGDVEGDVLRCIHFCDGALADTGTLAFFRLSRAVSKQVSVVLSGDGGDEFFAGYETYAATRIAARVAPFVPRAMVAAAGRFLYGVAPRSEERLPPAALAARFMLALGDRSGAPHARWRRLVQKFLLPGLYGPALAELAETSPYTEYDAAFEAAQGGLLDRALLADQQFHIQSVLAKTDLMSMAHGLEVRVPLLDRRVMDLAGRLAIDLLNPPGGPTKCVLRNLAKAMGAPPAVISGRKRGFNVPIARLLRRDLRAVCDGLFVQDADLLAPFLRPDGLRRLWAAHRDGEADHAFALWPLLTLAAYRSGRATAASTNGAAGAPPRIVVAS
jgi:asparagine synthase (glutamine-hydrolysing)